jgi:hypothetical protein
VNSSRCLRLESQKSELSQAWCVEYIGTGPESVEKARFSQQLALICTRLQCGTTLRKLTLRGYQMRTALLTVMNVVVMGSAVAVMAPGTIYAQQDPAPAATTATEDILHMSDGRVLRGQIISETRAEVVFEYRDDKLKMKTKLTLQKDTIALIERDVAMAEAPPTTETSKPASSSTAKPRAGAPSTSPITTNAQNYGVTRVTGEAEGVPSIYVVPCWGQMGTDIRASEYKVLIEDIKAVKPKVVVFDVKCSDTSELMFPEGYNMPESDGASIEEIRRREWGMLEFEDYREFVRMFQNELRDIPQVVWVHDSDGVSATIFMAWKDLYMSPQARLGSKVPMLMAFGAKSWADPDVRAKMIAAVLGITKGFLERGGYSLALADAMLDVDPKLSGEWRGREVIWTLDDNGQYLVDGSDKHAAYFTAKSAEDFCISDGTAESIDDLALLLGFREFKLIEGRQAEIQKYVESWRREYKESQVAMKDYAQYMGWAGGDEAAKWLGKAKGELEKILRAMERYPAIEVRWERDYGLPKLYFITTIDRLREQLADMKRRGGTRTRGGGGGGGGRTGGGGGGGF